MEWVGFVKQFCVRTLHFERTWRLLRLKNRFHNMKKHPCSVVTLRLNVDELLHLLHYSICRCRQQRNGQIFSWSGSELANFKFWHHVPKRNGFRTILLDVFSRESTWVLLRTKLRWSLKLSKRMFVRTRDRIWWIENKEQKQFIAPR